MTAHKDDKASLTDLTLFLPRGEIVPPENSYGRLIANSGLYKALLNYGDFESIHIQTNKKDALDDIKAELGVSSCCSTNITVGPPTDISHALKSGILLSGQPYIKELAWARRGLADDGAYSIVGSIFAFSSPKHREEMIHSSLAPIHPWDALICSSPNLEAAVSHCFDGWESHLVERFGAQNLFRPALPVIPLGVNVERVADHSSNGDLRNILRDSNNIHKDDVVVLFLGRLSFYDKAFPQPMFRAVYEAQQLCSAKVHLIMAGWFPDDVRDRRRFEEAAQAYAPGLSIIMLDGNDPDIVAQCWAGSDIYLSLSDTVLETFGQAPVEAMAAGLPLVISDWDGYKFIVRDGEDGYLIPTLFPMSGQIGETLARLESMNALTWAHYMGAVAQHTAVNIEAAVDALTRLIKSPELRRSMGSKGRAQALQRFSWKVVVKSYIDLFKDLSETRRLAGSHQIDQASDLQRNDPLKNDPFIDFQGYPSKVLTPDLMVYLTKGSEDIHRTINSGGLVELDKLFSGMRGDPAEINRITDVLRSSGEQTVECLLSIFPSHRRPFLQMSILWLMKRGILGWAT